MIELLYGTSASTTGPAVTNIANMIDGAFNDVVADINWNNTGFVTWDTISNSTTTDALLDAVVLEVRFYNDAIIAVPVLNLEIFDGTDWTILATYNTGNPPPTTLTTVPFTVSGILDTVAKINACQVRFNCTAKKNGNNAYVDEARLIVTSKNQVNVFDTIAIAEVATLLDLVVELGPVVENITIAEDISTSLSALYLDVSDSITVADVAEHLQPSFGELTYQMQNVSWFDGTYHWRGWFDRTNDYIKFEYTQDPDGSWTENVNARISDSWANDFSVYGGATNCGVVYRVGTATIKTRYANVVQGYPSTTWAWSIAYTVVTSGTDEFLEPTFTRISDGYFHCVYVRVTSGGKRYLEDSKSTNTDDPTAWDSPVAIGDTNNEEFTLGAVTQSDDGSKGFCLFAEGTQLQYSYWNGSVWSSAANVATIALNPWSSKPNNFDTVWSDADDENHFIYIKSDGTAVERDFEYGVGLGSEKELDANTDCLNPSVGQYYGDSYIAYVWTRPIGGELGSVYYVLERLSDHTLGDAILGLPTTNNSHITSIGYSKSTASLTGFITWEESSTVYSKSFGMATIDFDNITIAEDIEFFWSAVGVPTPFDAVTITENIDASLDVLNISVDDSVTITENVSLSLGALYLSVYDDVTSITESLYINLTVLYLSVFDESIAVFEFLDIQKTAENVVVSDAITIAEYTDISLATLNLIVFEFSGLLITESISVIDLVVEVGVVADFTSVTENLALSLDVLNINVGDAISTAENFTNYLDVLNIDTNDSITITEYVELLDITIELDTVFDSITATEYTDISLGTLNISTNDAITVTEDITILLPTLIIDVFDATSIAENISIDLDVLNISVSENVIIVQDSPNIRPLTGFLDVDDSIHVDEDIAMYLDVYNRSVLDAITITEVTTFDIPSSIDDGDVITIIENASVSIPFLDINQFDSLAVTEDLSIYLPILNIDTVYDDVAISENIDINLDALNQSIFDSITVTEDVTIFDIVIELGIVSDSISIVEYTDISLDILYVDVADIITAIEYTDISLGILYTNTVFDNVATTEDIDINLDVLNVDVSDVISSAEYVNMLDIIIELGPVYDNIIVSEYMTGIIALPMYVFEDITIEESTSESFYVWKALYKMYLESLIIENINA